MSAEATRGSPAERPGESFMPGALIWREVEHGGSVTLNDEYTCAMLRSKRLADRIILSPPERRELQTHEWQSQCSH